MEAVVAGDTATKSPQVTRGVTAAKNLYPGLSTKSKMIKQKKEEKRGEKDIKDGGSRLS